LWASAVAAIVGSLCRVAPLVLLTLGVSGAWISQLTALEPSWPSFIGVMLAFIGLAFRELYKSKAGDCCVFCSYGSAACPPIQEQRNAVTSS
jgi:mercuric ion transport protein